MSPSQALHRRAATVTRARREREAVGGGATPTGGGSSRANFRPMSLSTMLGRRAGIISSDERRFSNRSHDLRRRRSVLSTAWSSSASSSPSPTSEGRATRVDVGGLKPARGASAWRKRMLPATIVLNRSTNASYDVRRCAADSFESTNFCTDARCSPWPSTSTSSREASASTVHSAAANALGVLRFLLRVRVSCA